MKQFRFAPGCERYWWEKHLRDDYIRECSRVGMVDNYDLVLNYGFDYIDAENAYRSKYHNMYITRNGTPEAWDAAERAERALHALCDAATLINIPADVIVGAARVMNRYYERTLTGNVIDAEKLIRSMI